MSEITINNAPQSPAIKFTMIFIIMLVVIAISALLVVNNVRKSIEFYFQEIGVRLNNGQPQIYIKYQLVNKSILKNLTLRGLVITAIDDTGQIVATTSAQDLEIVSGYNNIYLGLENIAINVMSGVDIALLDFTGWQLNIKATVLFGIKINQTINI